MASERCSKQTHHWPDLWCSRRGIVTEDGKLWCKQHAPSNVKAKNEARLAKIRAGIKADAADYAKREKLADIERRILAAAWDYNDLDVADDREILDRLSALVSEYRRAGGKRPD